MASAEVVEGVAGWTWDRALLTPREIVLFGASSNRQRLSSQLMARLDRHGYTGPVHLVNPRGGAIDGRTVNRSVTELHQGIDLALILVPGDAVAPVLRECDQMNVGAAVVMTAGADRQSIAEARGAVRVLGPNSQGLVSAGIGLAATFSHAARSAPSGRPGPSAVVSQSGAVAGVLWDSLCSAGMELAYWVTTGNEADLDIVDMGRRLGTDENVEQVLFYVEGLRRGPEFLDMLVELREAGKQAVILASGRSELGKAAAITHTASAAGDFEVLRHLCEDRGAVVLSRVEDVVSLSQVHNRRRRAAPASSTESGVTIVSSSGGFGAMLVDELHEAGLPVARLADTTTADLRGTLPDSGSAANPVDLTAGFLEGDGTSSAAHETLWTHAGRRVAADPATTVVALVISMVTGDVAVALTEEIRLLVDELDVPVCIAWLGGDLTEEYRRRLRAVHVPVYGTLTALVSAVRWLTRDDHRAPVSAPADRRVADTIDEASALEFLGANGVAVPRWCFVRSADEAVAQASEYGGRVVLKGLMPGVLHKTGLGLVAICDSADLVAGDYDRLRARLDEIADPGTPIALQEYIEHDTEILVGLKRDRVFGAVLVLGVGGVSAGPRTAVHIARTAGRFSASDEVARAISELALPDLPASIRAELSVAMERLADAMAGHPHFDELEINPIGFRRERHEAVALDIVVRTRWRTR